MRIAVDIGGTFTDIVAMSEDGFLHESKVSTTPDDPSRAVIEGVAALLDEIGRSATSVAEVLHGTTVGSNAILQRTGAPTGLITTMGFRDVLEIGRIRMPEMFDLTWAKPKPLVARRHRIEVPERIAADGSVVRPLDEAAVDAAARVLAEQGIEAVAICFINSYRNPVHEQRAERIVRAAVPSFEVTTSSAVLPEMKEYERTSTTVVNAYLLKAMRGYLDRLQSGLRRIGIAAPVLVMTSNGGMLPAAEACRLPAFVVASGPAGGVIGGARLGEALNESDVIVFDMGGTTAKAVIVEDGRPSMTSEYEFRDGISTSSRFIKAGGYMLKVPAIDIAEVGAGGGSLAGMDGGGLLRVGPESAGADPGPACYRRGNDRPTVTDANVALGLYNPTALAGGRLAIDRASAIAAVERHVARPLGISVDAGAHGIRAVANAAMARAIRAVTVERGRDPRDMALIAIGGSGGAHAADIARLLGIGRIVIPPLAGVFSSVGMLSADVEHNFVHTMLCRLRGIELQSMATTMAGLAEAARARLAGDGYAADRIQLDWYAEVRYEGQASELSIRFAPGPEAIETLARDFAAEYRRTYGYEDETAPELVKLRLVGRGLRDRRLDFAAMRTASHGRKTVQTVRLASFARDQAPVQTPILDRAALDEQPRRGPLIVEEFDVTIVVPPDAVARRHPLGSIIIELETTT
ncbi:MAG: hydantoinase/oxoprolinase family protein [Alphaproteobacteria bacterium]|nr:hydantoinase/oxoprolinase family protein [Alphaproteobacteria bacterium]